MRALANSANSEEVMEDINDLVFNCIEPKVYARILWHECEELLAEGKTESFIYDYVNAQITLNRQYESKD